jgi:assimilatory nitrate reductase electron transfer subunit
VLADGQRRSADLLVVACGVRANTDLAEAAGLTIERGVVVDDRLRTSDPRIYAIGDCAQHPGTIAGLVAPAWDQSRVVADLLAGDRPLARYTARPAVTRLKALGIDLACVGESAGWAGETVTFADPGRGTYAKLVVRGDRLVGAIMLGDNPTVGSVIQLVDHGTPLPADRRSLLLGRATPAGSSTAGSSTPAAPAEASPALMPDAAVICQCNNVTKGALTQCWSQGATSTVDLVNATRAGTGCGTCRDAVAGIAAWLRREESP